MTMNAMMLPRFEKGLTDRSLDSMISADVAMVTPTTAYPVPNRMMNTTMKTHMIRNIAVLPRRVLPSMVPSWGARI